MGSTFVVRSRLVIMFVGLMLCLGHDVSSLCLFAYMPRSALSPNGAVRRALGGEADAWEPMTPPYCIAVSSRQNQARCGPWARPPILQDHDVVRIVGAAEYLAVGDPGGGAAFFVAIIGLPPCTEILDFKVKRKISMSVMRGIHWIRQILINYRHNLSAPADGHLRR
jgi:hypothetical protein